MSSLRCPSCAAPSSQGNRFCEECGTELAAICPSCGRPGSLFARFCGGCGASRQPAVAPAAAGPRAGELKQATVLFADIVSSTEHIANLDPEEAMEQLQPAVAQMCDAIVRYGGTVMRTLGDGVMALFGLPRALEDHAQLACQAALAMQQAFRNNGADLAIRVGLHSGLVASDPASHDAMRGGGAHGLVIHIASRVVALADPGGICLTADCAALLRDAARTRQLGPRFLKGLREPVEVHALEALSSAQAPEQVKPLGRTRFCGREDELTLLQQALDSARGGDAQVVGVRAPAGTGKSRLCKEFADRCREAGVPVFQVRVQPYGHATPLQPIVEILRGYLFGIAREEQPAHSRARIAARLAAWPGARAGDADLLHEFLGVGEPRQGEGQEVQVRRTRLFEIFEGLARTAAGSQAVILLEDLHWLDDSSEQFVAGMAAALRGTRTLMLLNYRPRTGAAWEQHPHFRCIDLRELSTEQTEEMVRALMSHRAEFQNICGLIARRSGGNPFFAEELVRSVAQGSAFAREGAANGPQYEFIDDALPETVQAVVAARIDRLGAEHKKLLQVCAIVGKEVPFEILHDVVGGEAAHLEKALEELCRLEFLQMPAPPPHLFAFGHPLIQEVAYATQLKATRSAVHAQVGESMEARFGDRAEHAALIGHHFEAAGRPVVAARHISRAARWLAGADSAAASRQWQRVRAMLQSLPRSPEVDRLRMRACGKVASVGWHSGGTLAEVQPYIDEAKALAAEADPRYMQMLLVIEGRLLVASGASADEYVQRMREALALVEPGDASRRAVLTLVLAHAYGRAGLMREALDCNERAWGDRHLIDPADHDEFDFGVNEWMLAMRGRSLARCGRFEEAEAAWHEMLAAGPVNPQLEAIAHLGRVEHAWCVGDPGLARDASRRMEGLAAQLQVPYVRALAQFCSGMAALAAEDVEGALPRLTAALSVVRSHRVAMEFEPELLAALAECALRTGEPEEARGYGTSSIRIARARGARIAECRALIVLGMIHAVTGVGQPADSFDAAEELVRRTGAIDYHVPLLRARREFEPPVRATAGF